MRALWLARDFTVSTGELTITSGSTEAVVQASVLVGEVDVTSVTSSRELTTGSGVTSCLFTRQVDFKLRFDRLLFVTLTTSLKKSPKILKINSQKILDRFSIYYSITIA